MASRPDSISQGRGGRVPKETTARDHGPSATPLLSIAVAVRNARTTIQRCLDSVAAQAYPAVELVVIDGASDDGTVEILERNASRFSYWESKPDRGVYHAWNKAIDQVHGEWISFLGSDDRLAAPDVLSRMAPHLARADETHRVVYGKVEVVDGAGSVVRTLGQPWAETREAFRDHMSLPHPATFQRRSLFEEHGRFDESYRIAGDYEFLLRELLDRDATFVPDVTVIRMSSGGLSDRPASMPVMIRESHRARYRHGLVDVPEWRSFAVARSLLYWRLRLALGPGVANAGADLYRFAARKPRAVRK